MEHALQTLSTSVTELLKKYSSAETYLERFCSAPPEPYYARGPVDFITTAIKKLNDILPAH